MGKEEVECSDEKEDREEDVDGESVNELSNEENAGILDTESKVVIRLDSSICCMSVCVSGVPSSH